jgi:hypothetical protein
VQAGLRAEALTSLDECDFVLDGSLLAIRFARGGLSASAEQPVSLSSGTGLPSAAVIREVLDRVG